VQSEKFKRHLELIFAECDLDGGGTLDSKEVYVAILRLYTDFVKPELAVFATPPSYKLVLAIIEKNSNRTPGGTTELEFEDFKKVGIILARSVGAKVFVDWITELLLAPLLAWFLLGPLLDYFIPLDQFIHTYIGEETKYVYYMLRQSYLQRQICQNILPFFVHSWLDRQLGLVDTDTEGAGDEGGAHGQEKSD
jgi:hypothetical protein